MTSTQQDEDEDEDGRASPPPSFHNRVTSIGCTLPPLTAKEKPPINVVGDVGGRIAIMVDDMIDDVQVSILHTPFTRSQTLDLVEKL
jgi:phosphoribosylpyrophosphate synthetase